MRELSYVQSPERHELFSLFMMNELLAARVMDDPVLHMMLPAADGAEVDLPVPALCTDLFGDRTRTTLNLSEALHRFLELGGHLELAVGAANGRMDAALLSLAQDLMARSYTADVRAFEDLNALTAVGQFAAIEASMRPGPFQLDRGIFRYYAQPEEIGQRRQYFTALFQSGSHLDWRRVVPR